MTGGTSVREAVEGKGLMCPLIGVTCAAEGCALAVSIETFGERSWYCGLVATRENVSSASRYTSLNVQPTKTVTRAEK